MDTAADAHGSPEAAAARPRDAGKARRAVHRLDELEPLGGRLHPGRARLPSHRPLPLALALALLALLGLASGRGFVGRRTSGYARQLATGGGGGSGDGAHLYDGSPFSKSDPTRAAIRANKRATKYMASKAKREEYYAARRLKQDDQFAAMRAKRATHFEAWQTSKKGFEQVRKAIRDTKW